MRGFGLAVPWVVLVAGLGACRRSDQGARSVPQPVLVAHAGGAVQGMDYTNSRQAFDASYAAGLRFFEVDIALTSDGRLVLVHGWNGTFPKLFGGAVGPMTLREFMALKMKHGLQQMATTDLYQWLDAHPDAYVITDVKGPNLDVLRAIAKQYSAYASRFIPQIYYAREFEPARRMGYRNIIYTLYRSPASDEQVLGFCRQHRLLGVTMRPERAAAGRLAKRLKGLGVFIYVHTINTVQEFQRLRRLGVHGVYTDVLTPPAARRP